MALVWSRTPEGYSRGDSTDSSFALSVSETQRSSRNCALEEKSLLRCCSSRTCNACVASNLDLTPNHESKPRALNSASLSSEFQTNSAQGPEERGRELPHSRHVFLCYKQPWEWPSGPLSFDWGFMPRSLRAAVQSSHCAAPRKSLLTVCEGRDDCSSGSYNGDVLLFPDMLLYRALTRFDIECFVEEALMQPTCLPATGRLQPEPLTGCHVFVCCQRTSSSSCGSTGPKVASRLSEELVARGINAQVRIWRCCHLTTQVAACQGNIVIFRSTPLPSTRPTSDSHFEDAAEPSCGLRQPMRMAQSECRGEWCTGVTPDDVPEIVEKHILGGQVLPRLSIGCMSKPPLQVLGHNATQLNGDNLLPTQRGKEEFHETWTEDDYSTRAQCSEESNASSCPGALSKKGQQWSPQSSPMQWTGVVSTAPSAADVGYGYNGKWAQLQRQKWGTNSCPTEASAAAESPLQQCEEGGELSRERGMGREMEREVLIDSSVISGVSGYSKGTESSRGEHYSPRHRSSVDLTPKEEKALSEQHSGDLEIVELQRPSAPSPSHCRTLTADAAFSDATPLSKVASQSGDSETGDSNQEGDCWLSSDSEEEALGDQMSNVGTQTVSEELLNGSTGKARTWALWSGALWRKDIAQLDKKQQSAAILPESNLLVPLAVSVALAIGIALARSRVSASQ